MPVKPKPNNRRRTASNKPPGRVVERRLGAGGLLVAGVDEVGRGAWAGPLVAAAVILPDPCRLPGIRDSKLLTAGQRERLAGRIRSKALAIGIGTVSIDEFNRHGFPWALRECGLRSLRELGLRPDHVLLDGHYDYFRGAIGCETIVGGDGTERCIAAASIVAKVHRDALMRELDDAFPGYGFAEHKGYGTPAHRRALAARGPVEIHRAQWRPVYEQLQRQLAV